MITGAADVVGLLNLDAYRFLREECAGILVMERAWLLLGATGAFGISDLIKAHVEIMCGLAYRMKRAYNNGIARGSWSWVGGSCHQGCT